MSLDRYELYEHCAQAPADLARVLHALHLATNDREAGAAGRLGEDFCGSAALSRAWLELDADATAVAVDHDDEPLARADASSRLTLVHGDVLGTSAQCDVIHAGNFSLCEWHTREALLTYLRHVRRRLNDGGLFVGDLYGGEHAFVPGAESASVPLPDGRTIGYTWEQRDVDLTTGLVTNAMHFQVERDDEIIASLDDAFVYRWRLWGLPELRDAMLEAGFARTAVYPRTPDAVDDEGAIHIRPLTGDDLDESFDVLVVAAPA